MSPTSLDRQRDTRIALVIGAGSVKCASAIGVMDVLREAGIDIDVYVGCSGGAMYAALAALGHEPGEIEQMTRELWTRELTSKRDWRAIAKVVFPRRFGFDSQFGLMDDTLIHDRLMNAFGTRTFADTTKPVHIVGTEFDSGQKVVMSEGSLVDAIRGSIALPFLFKPWKVGEHLVIDGCLSDPMPVDVAMRERADLILGIGFRNPHQRRINTLSKFAFQVVTVMTNQLLTANFAFQNLAHHNELLLVLPEFGQRIGAFEVGKLDLIIEAGRQAMRSHLPYVQQLIEKRQAG